MHRRILHLIPSLGPGGAERQLAYLARGLRAHDWEVHVGVLAQGGLRDLFDRAGAVIHDLPSYSNYDPLLVARLLALIRRTRPALVQTWLPMMDVFGGAAARLAGVPWLISERTSPDQMGEWSKLLLRALLARGASGVISNSAGGDDYWRRTLPCGVPRAVIRNAVPLEDLVTAEPPALREFGLPEDAPLVLYVGRIIESKAVDVLVRALARVLAATRAVGLLCGFGTHEEAARRWVAEAGLSGRVVVTGYVPCAYALLKRASVFVSLSRYEGMPNSVMEAMALGCPLVVSDIPAHRDLVDDSCGIRVPIDEVAAADALLSVLRDRVAATRRAEAARARAQRWSIPAVTSAYLDFYEAISGRNPQAA